YSFLLFLLFYYISLSDLYTLSLHDALPIYCYLKIAFNTFFLIVNDLNPALDSTSHPFGRRESFSSRSSLTSLPSQWSNCGPMDSFVARSLSSTDKTKFHLHLLQVTISCGFPLSWLNNPEVVELFKFLNPQIKLPDRKTLSNEIL